MKLVLVIGALLAICQASPLTREWNNYKKTFGKEYSSPEEDQRRMEVFSKTLEFITQHNMKYLDSRVSYLMDLNEFSDLTDEEFEERYLGFIDMSSEDEEERIHDESGAELPDMIDWRKEGMVTPVKHQGECLSSWAFSATGALEGQHFRQTKELVSLSEQNLLDCTYNVKYKNSACKGGFSNFAFKYAKEKGVDSQESYPYEGKSHKCRFEPANIAANCTGYVKVKSNSQKALKDAVANVGPVSAAILAPKSFRHYSQGVYYEPECGVGVQQLNHAVLVVGYGTEEGRDYWLVKNSWGGRWGDKGYVKIIRNYSNGCGISDVASYPTVSL